MPSGWLRFLRGCIRPDVDEGSSGAYLKAGALEGLEPCKHGTGSLAKRSEHLESNRASGASTYCFQEPQVREAYKTARRRSSSNVDALARLAEDETLAPIDQSLVDDPQRADAVWNEASRSSCPTIVERGCASAVGLEPATSEPPTNRPHSLASASAPKNSFCVSPVSAAAPRSAASPMRHDFMTLMRQASTRGSSSGAVGDAGGPSPHQASSPCLTADGCNGVTGHHIGTTDWPSAEAVAARQTYGGPIAILDAARHHRQRRASAFAAGERGALDGSDAATAPGGTAASYCPPCPLPAGAAAASFARCSSSPDMRLGGVLLASACSAATASSVLQEARLVHSPYTAPALVLQQPISCAASCASFREGGGAGAGSGGHFNPSGGSGVSGGGGAVPPMLRSCQAGAGRNGYELRPMQPSHSPLRPKDLPPPASTAANAAAAAGTYPAAGSGGPVRQPASVQPSPGSSYQQIRLLQQLREQHELHHQSPKHASTATAVADAAAAAAAALAAAAVAAASSSSLSSSSSLPAAVAAGKSSSRPGTTGDGRGAGIKWVQAYFSTEPASVAGACSGSTDAVAVAATACSADAEAAVVTGGGSPVASAPAAGCRDLRRAASVASAVCSDILLPDSPSAALPSISTFLAAAPGSLWTDVSDGVGDSSCWGAAGASADAASGALPPIVPVPVLQPHMAEMPADLAPGGRAAAAAATQGGGVTEVSQETSVSALQGAVVCSLGETFSVAAAAAAAAAAAGTGSAHAGAGSSQANTAAQAVLVIQNLLLRNALPDGGEPPAEANACGRSGVGLSFVPACRQHAASSAVLRGDRARDGGGGDFPQSEGQQQPWNAVLDGSCLAVDPTGEGTWEPAPPRGGARGNSCSGGRPAGRASPGGGGIAAAVAAVELKPEPVAMMLIPSRSASPAPDSLAGSDLTTRSGTRLLIIPLPSEGAAAAAAAAVSSSRCGSDCSATPAATTTAATTASLLPGARRLSADAQCAPLSSVCSPSPSQLLASPTFLDTASPFTPAYHGLQISLSMQSLSGQASCGAAAPVSNRSATAYSTVWELGSRDASRHLSATASGDGEIGACEPEAAAVASGHGGGEQSTWGSALGGGGGGGVSAMYGSFGNGGCGGGSNGGGGGAHGRSSMGVRRGSSVFASESSLAAIALLRSAATNCQLPDDGGVGGGAGGGGGGSHVSMLLHTGAAGVGRTTTTGGSLLGLNTMDGGAASSSLRSITASTADPGSPAPNNDRCIPLAAIFANVAWPPALTLPPPLALPLPLSPLLSPPGGLPYMSPPAAAVVQQAESSTQSLRLEDGLVADPVLLVDGLGQLSYMTSGAYAAVYRGVVEDMPVGIKFLASTSLDLNAPAVKEALLGPGLEHENIIRTYTTRVARVDGRAVSQLRAVAAAMVAAAALHRKRSSAGARRFSTGAPAGCSPLSVPSTPLAATQSAAVAAAAAHRRAAASSLTPPVMMTAAATRSPAAAVGTQSGGCDVATRLTVTALPPGRLTPPAAAAASSNAAGGGSPSSRAGGHGRLQQLPIQALPARALVDSAPCNVIFPPSHSGMRSPFASAAEGGPKARLVSASGVLGEQRSPHGAAAAAAAADADATTAAAAAAVAVRQLYMRKSVSANARAEMTEYRSTVPDTGETATTAVAVAPPPPPPSPLSPASRPSLAAAGQAAPRRRGSALMLTDGRAPLLPQSSPQQLPQQPSGGGAGGARAPAPRGSAAERVLDVLLTLGVIGPTGQPTAEAHYVTAVVMEFADAGNLDSFSRAVAPCDLVTAVDLLRQVACGMSYLHAHGLVHGDLKPANVLLQRDPDSGKLVAKVADFGLSGLSGQLGSSGGPDTCGTVAYSAPERLAEEARAEHAADVYSFGICMQQLVSGVRPFAELTFGQVMFSVLCLKTRPPWPEGRCGALEPLYGMCCDEQPAKRPTFDQVVAWLDSRWA